MSVTVFVLERNPADLDQYETQAIISRYSERGAPPYFERIDDREGLSALYEKCKEPVILLNREADVAVAWKPAQRGIPCLLFKAAHMGGAPMGRRLHRLSPLGDWFEI